MPLMLPAQGLPKPVDDASGVELPPRFAETPEQHRSILLMISDRQAGCFSQLHAALAPSAPGFAMTL